MRICTSERAFSPNVEAPTRYHHFTQAPEPYQLCQAHQISVSSLRDLTRSCMYPRQLARKRASEATALCAVFALEMAHDGVRIVGGTRNSLATLQCPIQLNRFVKYTVWGQPWSEEEDSLTSRAPAQICASYLLTSRGETMSSNLEFKFCLY